MVKWKFSTQRPRTIRPGPLSCPDSWRGGDDVVATSQTTTSRGYGAAHQAERRRWEPTVRAGHAMCARCGESIPANEPWDLGHNDDRTEWTGPEHVKCNRAAGARNATAARVQKNAMTVRNW